MRFSLGFGRRVAFGLVGLLCIAAIASGVYAGGWTAYAVSSSGSAQAGSSSAQSKAAVSKAAASKAEAGKGAASEAAASKAEVGKTDAGKAGADNDDASKAAASKAAASKAEASKEEASKQNARGKEQNAHDAAHNEADATVLETAERMRLLDVQDQEAVARGIASVADAWAEQLEDEAARAEAKATEAQRTAKKAEQQAKDARAQADAARDAAQNLKKKALVMGEAAALAKGESLTGAEAMDLLDASDEMTGTALKKIPGSKGLAAFSLLEGRAEPELEAGAEKAIRKAIGSITDENNDCGAVFIDLNSGRGIAYNAKTAFYTASSSKAALVFYALTKASGSRLSDYDRENAEAALRYSSNEAYDEFALSRMGKDYIAWLNSYEIEYESDMPYYVHASARSMARIWADIFQYLQSDAKDATWFSDTLASTTRSFIRDAVGGKKVEVRNKAGWIADEGFEATADCAYIDAAGHPYLMVVLTDQPDSEPASSRAAKLAKALFAAAEYL